MCVCVCVCVCVCSYEPAYNESGYELFSDSRKRRKSKQLGERCNSRWTEGEEFGFRQILHKFKVSCVFLMYFKA
jgi:hypothetical protein